MSLNYILLSREQRFHPPNISVPTRARPGSQEKLRVLIERYRCGQPLHHPHDFACTDRPRYESRLVKFPTH